MASNNKAKQSEQNGASRDQPMCLADEPDVRHIDKLNSIIFSLRENQEDLIDPTNEDTFGSYINELYQVSEERKRSKKVHMDEVSCDALALNLMATIADQKCQALSSDVNQFNDIQYAENLRAYIIGDDEDITFENSAAFGKECCKLFKFAPTWQTMCGTLDREEVLPKPKAERKRRTVDKEVIEKTKPEKLKTFKNVTENEVTAAKVSRIRKTLEKKYKCNPDANITYFQIICDPHSFSQTVENMFYVGFLLKDAYVSLDDDSIIRPVPDEERTQALRSKNEKRIQNFVRIHKQLWQEKVQELNITKALLPS